MAKTAVTIGTNLKYKSQSGIWGQILKQWGVCVKPMVGKRRMRSTLDGTAWDQTDDGTTAPRKCMVFSKASATAPTTNAAADSPSGLGDLCLHDNSGTLAVYVCTAFVSSSSFTWTKIS